MKDYPKGWKPPKKKYHKAPTPPPGQIHGSKDEYKRSRDRRAEREIIEEDLMDTEECPKCGDQIEIDEFEDHVVDCDEYKDEETEREEESYDEEI